MTYVSVITLVTYALVLGLLAVVSVIDVRSRRVPNVLAGALGLDTTVSNPNAADGFGDASQIGSYAKTAVFWAVERGIMGGHNNLLTPKSSATRVQLAQMLYSFDTVYAD